MHPPKPAAAPTHSRRPRTSATRKATASTLPLVSVTMARASLGAATWKEGGAQAAHRCHLSRVQSSRGAAEAPQAGVQPKRKGRVFSMHAAAPPAHAPAPAPCSRASAACPRPPPWTGSGPRCLRGGAGGGGVQGQPVSSELRPSVRLQLPLRFQLTLVPITQHTHLAKTCRSSGRPRGTRRARLHRRPW